MYWNVLVYHAMLWYVMVCRGMSCFFSGMTLGSASADVPVSWLQTSSSAMAGSV